MTQIVELDIRNQNKQTHLDMSTVGRKAFAQLLFVYAYTSKASH